MATEILSQPIGVAQADPRIATTHSDRTGPAAVEAIGNIAGDIVQNVQEGRALKQTAEDVQRFNAVDTAASRGLEVDLNTGKIVGGAQTQEDAALQEQLTKVYRSSEAKFRELALAREQFGSHSASMMARLHTEASIRELAMQTPGFESEIRQTAASVLGYDPMGFGIRRILDVASPKDAEKTEQDKFMDSAHRYMEAWNHNRKDQIDINEAARRLNEIYLVETQNKMYSTSKANGTVTFEGVLGQYSSQKNSYLVSLAKRVRDSGISATDAPSIRNLIETMKDEDYRSIIRDAGANPGFRVDAETQRATQFAVDQNWKGVETILADNGVAKLALERVDQFEAMSQEKMIELAPGLMMISKGVDNQAVAGQLADILFSVGGEQQARIWLQNFPELRAILKDEEKPMESINRIALGLLNKESVDTSNMTEEELKRYNDGKKALAKNVYLGAEGSEARSAWVKQLGEGSPDFQLSLVSADPTSFAKLDNEARTAVAASQAAEVTKIIDKIATRLQPSFYSKNPGQDFRIDIDPETGKLLPMRRKGAITGSKKDIWVRADEGVGKQSFPEIEAYNNVHRRLYADPQWRNFITDGKATSAADASRMALAGIETKKTDRLYQQALEKEQELMAETFGSGKTLNDQELAEFQSKLQTIRKVVEDRGEAKDIADTTLLMTGVGGN